MPNIGLPRSLPNADLWQSMLNIADQCLSMFYWCLDPALIKIAWHWYALIGIGHCSFLHVQGPATVSWGFYAGHWSCKLIKLKYNALIDVQSWKEQNFNLPETDKFCWHAPTVCYTLNLNSLHCKWRRNLLQLACISRLSGIVHVKHLSMEMYKCCFSTKLLTLISISVRHSHTFLPIQHGITSVTWND